MAKQAGKGVVGTTATPLREVHVSPSGGKSAVAHHGVAITGNQGQARSAHFGASIAGDSALAEASNGAAVLAGWHSHASSGDGSIARAGSYGFATGYIRSMMMVDDGAWALSLEPGIAFARAGLAETVQEGIAVAQTRAPQDGGQSGIAVAGPCGIAFAFDEGVVVRAGPGGALAGYCTNMGKTKLVIEPVSSGGHYKPDTFYRFVSCGFNPLSKTEEKKVLANIASWRKAWNSKADQMSRKEARLPRLNKAMPE